MCCIITQLFYYIQISLILLPMQEAWEKSATVSFIGVSLLLHVLNMLHVLAFVDWS